MIDILHVCDVYAQKPFDKAFKKVIRESIRWQCLGSLGGSEGRKQCIVMISDAFQHCFVSCVTLRSCSTVYRVIGNCFSFIKLEFVNFRIFS